MMVCGGRAVEAIFHYVMMLIMFTMSFLPAVMGTHLLPPSPKRMGRFRVLVSGVQTSFTNGPSVSRCLAGCGTTSNSFASVSCDHASHAG